MNVGPPELGGVSAPGARRVFPGYPPGGSEEQLVPGPLRSRLAGTHGAVSLYWAIEAVGGADLTSPAGVGETLRKSYVTLLFAKCAGKALFWHKLMRTSRTLLSLASLGRQKIDIVVSGQLQDAWDVIQVVQGIEQRLQLARR